MKARDLGSPFHPRLCVTTDQSEQPLAETIRCLLPAHDAAAERLLQLSHSLQRRALLSSRWLRRSGACCLCMTVASGLGLLHSLDWLQ